MKKIIYFGTLICVFFCACRIPEQYSDIPEIKFINFEILNETDGILTYYFQDGDGDIGLDDAFYPPFDTSSIYYYNFFCDYYEKRNGIFEKIDSTEGPNGKIEPLIFHARIKPRFSNLPEESISGEIYHTMRPYRNKSPYDTIQLKFYIVDRKLNHSNIEEVIIIRRCTNRYLKF
jgi:hypothetical protein